MDVEVLGLGAVAHEEVGGDADGGAVGVGGIFGDEALSCDDLQGEANGGENADTVFHSYEGLFVFNRMR